MINGFLFIIMNVLLIEGSTFIVYIRKTDTGIITIRELLMLSFYPNIVLALWV